jgi:hypothetical protein
LKNLVLDLKTKKKNNKKRTKMKNKILLSALVAGLLTLSGCNDGGGTNYTPPQPVQPTPVPPQPIQPLPEAPDKVPGIGTGSVDYQPSCKSGFATVTYVYRTDAAIDDNSFVIVHSADGIRQDIISGSVYDNGSISKMEEKIFIKPNDTDVQVAHQIDVEFVSDGISKVNSFAFIQPSCEVQKPETPDEPDVTPPPSNDIPMYGASTSYNVGDYVRVDRGNIISTYRCPQANTSGKGGGWKKFRTELGNWKWVKDELPPVVINLNTKS